MHSPQLAHSQNFLHSPALVSKLVGLTNIAPGDLVIEIGPGRGIITRQLSKIGCRVIAVEYDGSLCSRLKRDFKDMSNVVIRYGDFLSYQLPCGNFKIIANIPFNITSAILARITQGAHVPTDAYLLLQEEAARRYAGLPYCAESLKSLLIKPRLELSILHRFAETDFSPAPRARVIFLHLHKRTVLLLEHRDDDSYRDFLCFVFSQPGSNVEGRLKSVFTYAQLKRLAQEWGFSLTSRPIDLSVEQWLGVFSYYRLGVSPEKRKLVEGAEKRLHQQQARLVKIHRNRAKRTYATKR